MKNKLISYSKNALFGFCESLNSQKFCIAIVLLRVMATCLITNTHYNNVYPSEKFAIGGLLGDVIFFAVSGYCIGVKNKGFSEWYTSRWIRIYPSVLIMSIIFLLFGFWNISDVSLIGVCSYFILPTNFMFFGAIMICYMPIYFSAKVASKKKFNLIILAWAILYVLYYLIFIDKTKYSMNAVSNPIILFLYFGAMLIGMHIKRNQAVITKAKLYKKIGSFILFFVFAVVYFAATIIVRANSSLYIIQFIVPMSLLFMCFFLVWALISIEAILKKMPKVLLVILGFIANLTLEIYVVQLIIIDCLEEIVFPVNWILITSLIIGCAAVLKLITFGISKKLNKLLVIG